MRFLKYFDRILYIVLVVSLASECNSDGCDTNQLCGNVSVTQHDIDEAGMTYAYVDCTKNDIYVVIYYDK